MTVRTRHHNAAAHREEIADQVNTNTTDISTLETQSPTLGTEVDATNSGADDLTVIDFTSLPSWAQIILVQFSGISTTGTSDILIQIGTSGSPETTNYLGSGIALGASSLAGAQYTSGFGINIFSAARILHGTLIISLEDAANYTWSASGIMGASDTTGTYVISGGKTLSAALDMVRVTTVGGSDTFDNGNLNILYE